MQKLRLFTKLLKSTTAKELTQALTQRVGYRVFRSARWLNSRRNLVYGDQVNKTAQYEWFKANNVPSLRFTTSHEEAKNWVEAGELVICRKLTRASEGRGIVVAETPEQVIMAPVYTAYRKKKREFRVHVFQGQIIQVLEKRRRAGFEEVDSKIRNHRNGWVFCSENVSEPEGLRQLALEASKVSSSDFKGVDIGYNEKKNELFVIEVNSAPGITGSNINRYVEAILHA